MRKLLLIGATIAILALIGVGSTVAGPLRVTSSDNSAQAVTPSGATIQGALGGDFDAHANVLDWGVVVSFPSRGRNYVTDADVFVNVTPWQSGAAGQTPPTTTDTSTGCSGTRANPTAPAGKVCIYITGSDNAGDLKGYSIVPGTGGNPLGFKLIWTNATTGDTFVEGTWAYHAP
jgi:hypothetical protein